MKKENVAPPFEPFTPKSFTSSKIGEVGNPLPRELGTVTEKNISQSLDGTHERLLRLQGCTEGSGRNCAQELCRYSRRISLMSTGCSRVAGALAPLALTAVTRTWILSPELRFGIV